MKVLQAVRAVAIVIAMAATFVALGAPTARALSDDAAARHVVSVVDRVVSLVRSDQSEAAKRAEFERILNETAAMAQLAKWTMGRNWRAMSAAQQQEFTTLFSRYIASAYVRRFSEYSGQEIEVVQTRDLGDKGILVRSEVSNAAEPIVVEWLISDAGGATLISDIVIEGVSMAQTQREEFAAMVDARGGDIDAFLSDIRAQAEG